MDGITRRDFSKAAAYTALSSMRVLGANDRVRIGFIGCGNRGDQVLDAFLPNQDAQLVAVAEAYEPYMEPFARKAGGEVAHFRDYRKMLEMKDLDAVVVATPDHWHALQTIHACEAGKDVYVEKPLSLTVVEGRKMVEAARRNKRVVQVGLNRRSSPLVKEAAELIRGGGIGKVTVVKSHHILNEYPMGIGNPADSQPPEGLDWNMWLGPAPYRPYNSNRCLYKFRWFWDYSGGQVTNFGTHYLDVIQWALGKDSPERIAALGGKLAVEDNREVPDTVEVLWQYGPTLVVFCQYNCNASAPNALNSLIEFRGTKGTLHITYAGYQIVPENVREEPLPALSPIARAENKRQAAARRKAMEPATVKGPNSEAEVKLHARNFLDCIKSRQRCNCDVEIGHRSTSAVLLGNIAYKTRSVIEWDGKTERITSNEAASRLLSPRYRAPWKLA